MSTKQVTYCDNCQEPKGETNHWYTAIEVHDSFTIADFDNDAPKVLDLCGEACLTERLQKWLHRPQPMPMPGKS